MKLNLAFFIQSISTGAALAMDAFSVSLANGLNETGMRWRKMLGSAGLFALFQFAMPMIGWLCVSTIADQFEAFAVCVPWIALALLSFIGGKMLYEGIRHKEGESEEPAVGIGGLLVQGVATSIDALSVGFTISDYDFVHALLSCLLIGAVTLLICLAGILIGKKTGTRLAGKASVFGGVILIVIGIKIFVEGLLA